MMIRSFTFVTNATNQPTFEMTGGKYQEIESVRMLLVYQMQKSYHFTTKPETASL